MIIYRGVNCELFDLISKEKGLRPQATVFEIIFNHNGKIRRDGSATRNISKQNAILGHQINSSTFKTSGISTTPHFERAKHYALNNNKYKKGYILEFDTDKLHKSEYEIIRVSDYVPSPEIPEDSEIIIKRIDNGLIPLSIVTYLHLIEKNYYKSI